MTEADLIKYAKGVVYLFAATFLWVAVGNVAMFTNNYSAGMAQGKIHYEPSCEWLARNYLGSMQSEPPTARVWQEMIAGMNRCNEQARCSMKSLHRAEK